jgi:hypothetical protein
MTMLSGSEYAVLNLHAAINHQMELDAAQTVYERVRARQRQSARHLANVTRRHCRLVALDAALVGSIAAVIITLLACMVV